MGRVLANQFNGSVLYNVVFKAQLCNPVEGMIIDARVININKMGILAYGGDMEPSPLNILIAKQHHLDNPYFDSVKENDKIVVSIVGVRKEYGDEQISVIAKLLNKDDLDEIESKKQQQIKEEINKEPLKYNFVLNNWLSPNYKGKPFDYKQRQYATVYHAFFSQKTNDTKYQDLFTLGSNNYIGEDLSLIKKASTKTQIKKLKLIMIDDWDTKQLEIMRDILLSYFEVNEDLKTKLIETGERDLIFTGIGIDKFWGIKDTGTNHHGKILMSIRESYKE